MVAVILIKTIEAYIPFAQKLQINWSKKVGNDLITPHPEFGFPGLKDGDCWCICATWYSRALEEGVACSIYLKKTNIKTLELIPIDKLKKHALDIY